MINVYWLINEIWLQGNFIKEMAFPGPTMTNENIKHGTTTGTSLANDVGSTSFPCPNCGKATIRRTRKAREIVVKYKCPECGFVGPN